MTVDAGRATGSNELRAVDTVEVQVLVDNATDQLSTNGPGVDSELSRLRSFGMGEWAGESVCCAHFGLSLLVTVQADGERHCVLFDAGPEGAVLERNARLLGVDFGRVDEVVLSHGHWDHAGGLLTALGAIRGSNGGRAVHLWMHPGMFRKRALRLSDGRLLPFKTVPDPETVSLTGAAPMITIEPRLLGKGLCFLSGEIPRVTSYERGLPNHVRRTQDGTDWEPDPLITDERFLAVRVKGKGLVVFTACSHAGVVNVLRHARRVFPDMPIHAVMGGFHLSGPGPEQIIPETVRDLTEFDLRRIVPAHCTGWRAVTALVNRFGDTVVAPSAVGKRFRF